MRGLATAPTTQRTPERTRSTIASRGRAARAKRPRPPADPILVTKAEAARVLGMSLSHFQRHVQHEIKCVYSGQLTLYVYVDLQRWAAEEATLGGRAIA